MKKTEGVDFCSCSSVVYQERDGAPGVLHTDAPSSTVKKTEGVDFCSCSSVVYQERDGAPGVLDTDKSGTCGLD